MSLADAWKYIDLSLVCTLLLYRDSRKDIVFRKGLQASQGVTGITNI